MAPIVVPHDPNWPSAFTSEAEAITAALDPVPITLHHIGSTSIPGICAKPTIDLLGVVPQIETLDVQADVFEGLGYAVKGSFGIDGRRFYQKRDQAGQRTHHLHVFGEGSPHIERHLAFRDYLRHHPLVAAQYGALKERLARTKDITCDSYIAGKEPFILDVQTRAIAWYRSR